MSPSIKEGKKRPGVSENLRLVTGVGGVDPNVCDICPDKTWSKELDYCGVKMQRDLGERCRVSLE